MRQRAGVRIGLWRIASHPRRWSRSWRALDDDGPLPRAWSSVQLHGGGQVEVVKDAGLDGSSALVVTVTAEKNDQAGYLEIRERAGRQDAAG